MEYKLISVDDHLFEGPDAYQSRVPAKLRDQAPKIVETEGGYRAWVIEGQEGGKIGGLANVAGRKYEEFDPGPVKGGYEGLPASHYDPTERLKAMDQDGVDVEVLFPGLPSLGGGGFFGIKDPELRTALYRAYNDHVAEDWRGVNPERFVAQCCIPLYDINETVAEIKRSYDKGHRCVLFPTPPEAWGFQPLGDKHWDPMWATIQELDIPVSIHIGSGPLPPISDLPLQAGIKGTGQAFIVKTISSNIASMADFMFSGILERFPRLKVVSVESGIGWVPYFLEQCDDVYTRQRYWTKSDLRMLPSEYAARQLYWNFWNEKAGLRLLDVIGENNVMWESDFPHSICDWPNSRKVVDRITEGIQPAVRQKILADNAAKLYKLS